MGIFDFRISQYFSKQWIFFGILLMIVGIGMLFKVIIVGVILSMMSTVIITTHYRLAIDLTAKTYNDYVWLIGLRFGEKGIFEKIDYIFIKKITVSQTMNSRGSSSTIRKEMFDSFLKFSEENKIHLLTMAKKEELIEKLTKLSSKINTKILDYSDGEPIEVRVQFK